MGWSPDQPTDPTEGLLFIIAGWFYNPIVGPLHHAQPTTRDRSLTTSATNQQKKDRPSPADGAGKRPAWVLQYRCRTRIVMTIELSVFPCDRQAQFSKKHLVSRQTVAGDVRRGFRVRRGSPDPAETADRRSPPPTAGLLLVFIPPGFCSSCFQSRSALWAGLLTSPGQPTDPTAGLLFIAGWFSNPMVSGIMP